MQKFITPLLLLTALWLPVESTAAPATEARAVMDETVASVLGALANTELDVDGKRALIEEIALARFDFETMAKLVLKRDWKKFTDPQKVEFVDAFRTYLSASYGSRITRYNQEAVDMAGERVESRGDVTVQTKIAGGDADGIGMDYRLRNRDGEWRIIDVVIEGISLVSNFRSQFSDVLSQGGPAELLRRLEEKNAEAAVARAEATEAAEGEAEPESADQATATGADAS